ncbi:MAG TPA: TonB-dependent receptor [Steroidobacteraceae bacterium]|nr:TonB-dependent receptor [Steroidobacteraceae bacterium]
MTAVSLEAMLVGPTVLADSQQTASASQSSDDLEELVVTGYRASLKSALDIKRHSVQPVESIVAEDLGKMPDQNVSESLQRLPGISINRSGGKGTQVLVDGLGNNLITLNGEVFLTGREFYVSGEASGGGNGGTVQYQSLEGIPSEEIGGIDVYKNPTAQNREGGLGGIIDLKTRSPLAQPFGLSLSGNARGTTSTGQDGGATPVITLVGGLKLSDNLAFTGSVSYDDEKTHDKQFQDQNRNQWLVTNTATDGSYTGSPVASTNTVMPNGKTYIDPQLGYFSDILEEVKTKGATLGAEWKWSDDITSNLNWFYVREEDVSDTYSNKAWFSGGSGETNGPGAPASFPGIDPTKPYSIDANGVVQSATFMANGAETATLYQSNISQANNYQFNTIFGGSGPVTGDVGVSYARATSDLEAAQADVEHGFYGAFGQTDPSIQMAAPGCNNGGNNCTNGNHGYAWTWTNGGTSGLPTANYADSYGYTNILSNPNYTLFKSNWAWANKTEEDQTALKGNLKFKANDIVTLTAGLRYAVRNVDQVFGRYLQDGSTLGVGGLPAGVGGTGGGNCCAGASNGSWLYYQDPGYAAIPWSTPQTNPGLVKYYNNFANGVIAVKDPVAGGMTNPSTYLNTVWDQAGITNNGEQFFEDTISSFKVKEKTTSAYLMGDAGGEGDAYHANFGLRVVKTNLTVDGGQTAPSVTTYGSSSWNGVNSNNVPFEKSRSYVDVLPSFNFVLNATDTQKIRVGAARVVAPQNLMDIGRGNSYGYTRGADDPNTGKPRFKFDGGTSGNPNLDPFRASQFNVDWEDYFAEGGLISVGGFYKAVDNFVTTANTPTFVMDDFGGDTANVSQPVNGGSGRIYGAEINAQYAFENGLGFAGNYTHANSDTTGSTAFAKNLPIPGVSNDSINLTVYYEHAGFSARVAYAWRSSALNASGVGSTFSFQDINGNPVVYGVYQAAYGQLDGQIGYDFNKHFGVLASVVNLTDSKLHTYLQFPNEPFTYDDTGRRFFFGVKAKL